MKKFIALFICLMAIVSCLTITSCRAADHVNHNLSQSADNFECLRKITVDNARTDLIIMEMEGYMSISNNTSGELVVTCKTGASEYKKNYVRINDYVIYVVEDITGTHTDPYHYKVHFYTPTPDIDVNY